MTKLGVIGGGAMGGPLITGISRAGLIEPSSLFLVEPDLCKREYLQRETGLIPLDSAEVLLNECEIVILAVKPQILPAVLSGITQVTENRHLIISIAAGVRLSTLESYLPKGRLVRVMPNTPARISQGISAYCLGRGTTPADEKSVTDIFNCVGKTVAVTESMFDAVTAVSGSGPAYVFQFLEALIDAAVLLGINRETARLLAVETLCGAAEMARQTGEHPAKLRNEVTSPGGTTAAALFLLEKQGFTGTVMEAVRAAAERSREMGMK